MKEFMCTMTPGLEEIAKEELLDRLKDPDISEISRGKMYFRGNHNLEELCKLSCVDNIYIVVSRLYIGSGKKDLGELDEKVKKLDFSVAEQLLGIKEKPKIIVSASKKGKHSYSRFDLSNHVTELLVKTKKFEAGDIRDHNFPIRLDLNQNECVFSVQLTKSDFRFRGSNYEYMPGGIRPTIASALIRISKPDKADVFYDPFCGAGTIPRERSYMQSRRILASDINPAAVACAKHNLPEHIKVFQCDARDLKVKDRSIDVIVSNIPWGKQIEVENITDLYTDFFREAGRVLKDKGRIVILTDREEIVECAETTGFSISKETTISLHGILAGIYFIQKAV